MNSHADARTDFPRLLRGPVRFQYTVRSLLVLLLIVSVALSIPAYYRSKYVDQWRAVESLRQAGVDVTVEPLAGGWMRWFVTKDAYCEVCSIYLAGMRVTASMMDEIGRCRSCDQMEFRDCVVDNDDFAKITNVPGLKIVYIADTNLSDVGLRHIGRFAHLTILMIDNANITASGLAGLVNL